MNNIFTDWHKNKDEVESQMLSAGLTRETLDKINKWMEHQNKESKDDSGS